MGNDIRFRGSATTNSYSNNNKQRRKMVDNKVRNKNMDNNGLNNKTTKQWIYNTENGNNLIRSSKTTTQNNSNNKDEVDELVNTKFATKIWRQQFCATRPDNKRMDNEALNIESALNVQQNIAKATSSEQTLFNTKFDIKNMETTSATTPLNNKT